MPYDVVAYEADDRAMLLSPEQEGFFHRLLRRAWMNGSIPDNTDELAVITRAVSKNQFRRAWEFIRPLWVPDPAHPGRLINEKQERERTFLDGKRDKSKGAAKVRWDKEKQRKELADADAMRLQCDGNASPSLSPSQPIPANTDVLVKNTNTSGPKPEKAASNGSRPKDLAYEEFAEAHRVALDALYVHKEADFVQLAKVRKTYDVQSRASPPHWTEAVRNYFASSLAAYTVADLCARLPIFRNGPVNEFGRLDSGTKEHRRQEQAKQAARAAAGEMADGLQ